MRYQVTRPLLKLIKSNSKLNANLNLTHGWHANVRTIKMTTDMSTSKLMFTYQINISKFLNTASLSMVSQHVGYQSLGPSSKQNHVGLQQTQPSKNKQYDSLTLVRKNSTTNKSTDDKDSPLKIKEMSLLNKLLILWGGGFVAIGLVSLINYAAYTKKIDENERSKKIERVHGGQSAFQYFLAIPCMRNTLMLSIVSGLCSWVVTFLLTSNVGKAYRALGVTPFVVGAVFMTYCTYTHSKEEAEAAIISQVLKDVQHGKVELMEKKDKDD